MQILYENSLFSLEILYNIKVAAYYSNYNIIQHFAKFVRKV